MFASCVQALFCKFTWAVDETISTPRKKLQYIELSLIVWFDGAEMDMPVLFSLIVLFEIFGLPPLISIAVPLFENATLEISALPLLTTTPAVPLLVI